MAQVTITENRVSVEWLILGDAAQVVGNKLYLLGGGWDVLTVNSGFPVTHHLAVAASFRVPWNDTNQRHGVEIEIVDEDRERELGKIGGEFEVGRPPGIPAGSEQRAQLAGEMDLTFHNPGLYVIRCRLDGDDSTERRVPFRVIEGPALILRKEREP